MHPREPRAALHTFLRGLAPRGNGPRGLYPVSSDLRGPPPTADPPAGASSEDLRVWAEGRVRPARAADATLAAALAAVDAVGARAGGVGGLAAALRDARSALAAGRADAFGPIAEAAAADVVGLTLGAESPRGDADRARHHAASAAWSALRALAASAPSSADPMVAFGSSLRAIEHAEGAAAAAGADAGAVALAFRRALTAR